jgi:single-strand DNA-binding protein
MRGFTRVFMAGHLGQAPEMRVSKNGRNYAKFSLAVRHYVRNENGDLQSRTDWHRVMVWGKKAELVCTSLQKGAAIAVEGRLTQYTKNQSADMSASDMNTSQASQTVTQIVADEVHFLNSKKEAPQAYQEGLLIDEDEIPLEANGFRTGPGPQPLQ